MNFDYIIVPVSILWVGSEIILGRLRHSQGSSAHDKSSLRIIVATITCTIFAGIVVKRSAVGHVVLGTQILVPLGILMLLAGLAIRWSAIFTLRQYFTVDVAIMDNHRVVTSGLYRYVRHPAYAGSLLSFLGLALSFANWISVLIIVVPITTAFIYRINVEEKALVTHLGESYVRYCAVTRRLVPGIY